MFRFTQKRSSGSQSQCLTKITGMVPMCLSKVLSQTVPSCMGNYTHAQQVGICRHNTDNVHIDKHSGTIPVILATH